MSFCESGGYLLTQCTHPHQPASPHRAVCLVDPGGYAPGIPSSCSCVNASCHMSPTLGNPPSQHQLMLVSPRLHPFTLRSGRHTLCGGHQPDLPLQQPLSRSHRISRRTQCGRPDSPSQHQLVSPKLHPFASRNSQHTPCDHCLALQRGVIWLFEIRHQIILTESHLPSRPSKAWPSRPSRS